MLWCAETALHFCTFLLNPYFDLEPDYIIRKPMKHRFQRHTVRTEIFSTFHARVEYISGENMWFCPLCYNLASRNSLLLRATKPKHWTDMVLHFCTFLLNPHFDLETDYIVRKPIKQCFQRYFVHTDIFSTFHARVEYISVKTVISGKTDLQQWRHSLDCTQTYKSENIISVSFTPFTLRI